MLDDATAVREWAGLLERHGPRMEDIARRLASAAGVAERTDLIISESEEALLGRWATVRSTAIPSQGPCAHHGMECGGRAEFRVRGRFFLGGEWTKQARLLCTPCRVETDDDRQCAYLTRILENKAYDHARQKARHPETPIDAPSLPGNGDADDVESEVEDREAAEALGRALRQLSEADRGILNLRYTLDHSVAETARKLGISRTAVTTRTKRAAERLRALLPAWLRERYADIPDETPNADGGEST